MKRIESLFYMIVITSFFIMMFAGTVYGASVTMQREGTLQNGQESAVAKSNLNADGNQLKLAPQRLRDKNTPGMESETGRHSVRMERYKPYKEGEGERKIK
jgi:hypothetical protein